MQQSNPLSQFFRQPTIHIRLPSGGKFYPPGTLTVPPNGELPVLPMTAVDEITYRTPDALFNGSAIVSVIQSCVPSIRNAWNMPSTDLDAVLVSVRIASFGHGLDISSTCPSCQHVNDVTVDLRQVNDNIRAGEYDNSLIVGNLEFYFRPLSYNEINQNNQVQFEQQQALRMLNDDSVDEMAKMVNTSVKVTSTQSVEAIMALA